MVLQLGCAEAHLSLQWGHLARLSVDIGDFLRGEKRVLFLHDSAETVFNDYNWLRSLLFLLFLLLKVLEVLFRYFQLDFGFELLEVDIGVFSCMPIRIDKVDNFVIRGAISLLELSLDFARWCGW